MAILPIAAAAHLMYCLETYENYVHNETGMEVQLIALLCMIWVFILWRRGENKSRIYTILMVISEIILIFVFYIGGKIPFCVECDQVTAEELGFFQHWIRPMDG